MNSKVAVIKKNYSATFSMYLFLTLLVLAGAGYYGYTQYTKLTAAQSAIITEQSNAEVLQTASDKYEKDYNEIKRAFEKDFAATLNSMEEVFPSYENYTALTRVLDAYFQSKNSTSEPIFNSDLKYSKPLLDPEKDYAVLPFSMTISASKNSFEDFLRYIESSGSLDDKTRVMDIKAISINFPQEAAEENATGVDTYNISLSMNSYFRKPVDIQ